MLLPHFLHSHTCIKWQADSSWAQRLWAMIRIMRMSKVPDNMIAHLLSHEYVVSVHR